jgi:type IV pilus assembly protein PilQ
MIKPTYVKIVLCLLIVALCLLNESSLSKQIDNSKLDDVDVGREDPFSQLPEEKNTSVSQGVSDVAGIKERTPELFLETITLKFLNAGSVKTVLEGLCSEYGRITVDSKSNSLIICDTKQGLERIKKVVPKEEILQTREKLTTGVYRIVYADIKEVEKTLKAFVSQEGVIAVNPGSNNIVVTDFESRVRAFDNIIKEIDRVTPQILVEVRIYDITDDEDFDLGIEWNAGRNSTERTSLGSAVTVPDSTGFGVGMDSTVGDSTKARGTTTRTNTPFIAGSYDELTGGSIRLGILNDTLDVDIALNILHERELAKLLANPRITVIDNEKATFDIVREIPYQEISETSQGGSMTGYKFKPVGVKLEVTPHVTRDGMIRLHIQPEFGVLVGTNTSPPTVDTRKVNTKALVKDGQTIVLGGLRQSSTTIDNWKVPMFGDIPLVGGLFKSKTESVKDTELLIFITPRIIVDSSLSARERTLLEETKMTELEKISEKPVLSPPDDKND